MNILITGGTGLIGRSYIEANTDHVFTVVTRNPSKAKLHDHTRLVDSLNNLNNLNEFDAIINLAGEPIIDKRWTDAQKTVIRDSRINTTKQLVGLINKSDKPPKTFLSGSAIGIYGHSEDQIITESTDITPNDFASQLCYDWEQATFSVNKTTRVVNLRTGIVLDKNKGALAKMLLPFKLGLGGKVGNGEQYMSWIHIKDYINALNYLLENESLLGAINLTAPNPVKNKDFTRSLASTLKRPSFLPMPTQVVKTLFGESSCLLLDSQNIQPKQLIESGFNFKYEHLTPALKNLLNN